MKKTNTSSTPSTPQEWYKTTAEYSKPDDLKSTWQISSTFALYLSFWAVAYLCIQYSVILALALTIPTACFLVRLFMIQHDCGHGSYFKSQRAQHVLGFIIGVLTLTPHQYWRRSHAYHHSHSGDLDFRGVGDISLLTVSEYQALTKWGRIRYRLYRNPFILLGLGPAFQFIIKHRYPWGLPRNWKAEWRSVWWTNLAIALSILILGYLLGYGNFLLIQAPVTIIASTLGVWLFYVQHQFEESYFHEHVEWDYVEAALKGSTHLDLPKPLQWLTASIGIHHVHHLNARIPNYKIEEAMKAHEALQQAKKIKLWDTFRLMNLALWDEENHRMIGFRELKRMMATT